MKAISMLLLATAFTASPVMAQDTRAAGLVDRAIARMGGEAVLRGVERMQYDYITAWGRFTGDARPYQDAGSYEHNLELRDYTIPAWRNARKSAAAGTWFEFRDIVVDSVGGRFIRNVRKSAAAGTWFEFRDIVVDSVGGRFIRNAWTPLNTAYVDERKELFTYTPDRLMLLAKDARDLKRGADTLIGGMAHTRVSGTINGYPSTIFFRTSDDLPAMFRFRAAQENDFGLTPWGPMDVEVWYSRWNTLENRMSIPTQWDIERVGQTYKRITVLGAKVNLAIAADSFAIPDSTRDAFIRTQRRPMHDVSYDAAKLVDADFASFPGFTGNYGAVRLGSGWVLLETGQAPLNAERAAEWLKTKGNGNVVAAVMGIVGQGNGGVAWLTANKVPVHVAPLAAPVVDLILRNRKQPMTGFTVVKKGTWIRNDGDSLWVEPVDLPNARGTLIVYSPRLRWLYSPHAIAPIDIGLLRDLIRDRKWVVERLGNLRGVTNPLT